MNTVQRVAKNTGVVFVGDIIFRTISLVVTLYLARYLGTVGFGKYSFVFAYLSFFLVITDFGLHTILVRDMSRDKSSAPKLIGNAYFIKLVLTVFAVVLSVIVISLMSYPPDTTSYIYVATFTLLRPPSQESTLTRVRVIIFSSFGEILPVFNDFRKLPA